MQNYMFDRAEQAKTAVLAEQVGQVLRRRKKRRGVLALGLFLAVIGLLAALMMALWPFGGQVILNSIEKGPDYEDYGSGDREFGILPDFYEREPDEEQETTIQRAQPGDGTVFTIRQDRAETLQPQDIYRAVLPSVVSITAYGEKSGSSGSGVVMSSDGYIITNYHVVEGAEEAWVELLTNEATQSGVYTYPAQLVGYYEQLDIAVLKIDAEDLVPAEFGSSRTLTVGEPAFALGNPMGYLYGTFTDGIISALERGITVGGYDMALIQTTAALNSGNSGGALVNESGQVIGITVAKIVSEGDSALAEGLGLAIPISEARGVINSILAHGDPVIPMIGIMCYAVDANGMGGIWVDSVEEDTPAKAAGLRAGDIIVKANGQRVTSLGELRDVLYDNGVEKPLTVTFLRSGKEMDLSFALFADE